MRITLAQWKAIEKSKHEARQAIHALETTIIDTMTAHSNSPDQEKLLLIELLRMAEDSAFHISRIDVMPQPEWTGGDSSNPKNFKIREPNCVPMPRGYLS